ncbi:MAG: Uma2 family endonuclease, partial [Spirulinaceae cyanobacterium]
MTSSAFFPKSTQQILPPRNELPTMYDLPSENPEEPGLPDEFHFFQPLLLYLTFLPTTWNQDAIYSATDMNLYYDLKHTRWYKRPDWFGAVGVQRLYEGKDMRLSYVTWQEEANPFVVVELLSPGTEAEDLGETTSKKGEPPTKWEVYEQILKIPYYIVFSRYTDQIKAFQLREDKYQEVNLTKGRLEMPELGLSLGSWQGEFKGKERLWLRWLTLEGELIPIPEEEVIVAQQEAIEARQEAFEAQQETFEARQEAIEAQQETFEAQQEAIEAQQEAIEAQQEAFEAQQEAIEAQQETFEARQEAIEVQQEAIEARLKAEKLAAKLRELGIN